MCQQPVQDGRLGPSRRSTLRVFRDTPPGAHDPTEVDALAGATAVAAADAQQSRTTIVAIIISVFLMGTGMGLQGSAVPLIKAEERIGPGTTDGDDLPGSHRETDREGRAPGGAHVDLAGELVCEHADEMETERALRGLVWDMVRQPGAVVADGQRHGPV